MLRKNRTQSSKGALTFVVLFALAVPGRPAAQTSNSLLNTFDAFAADRARATPIFTRPDVAAAMLALPAFASTTAAIPPAVETTGSIVGQAHDADPEEPLTQPRRQLPKDTTAGGQMVGSGASGRGAQLGSGQAVWYQHSGRTASGEPFNPEAFTAAHRTLPFGTRVRVVNKQNGRSVVVRINDRVSRQAARTGYVVDLSRRSARELGIEGVGSVALYSLR